LLDKNSCVSFPDKSFYQGIGIFTDYGFNVHTRDKDADIIYVSPSHMTSWGDVMPIKRRLELVAYSQQNNSLVIEDDYENEFQYNTHPTPSLYALGTDNIVYIGSFSAMLLPGIRISFMVLTKKLTDKFKQNESKFAQTASLTEQIALCNYIRDGHIYSQTRKIRRLYTAKTKIFYNLLKVQIPNINAKISENSLQVIITSNKKLTYEQFEKLDIKVYLADSNTLVLSPVGVKNEYYENIIKLIKSILI
jgi:GntR family transcriptional regulator/MocR family aminotransferase